MCWRKKCMGWRHQCPTSAFFCTCGRPASPIRTSAGAQLACASSLLPAPLPPPPSCHAPPPLFGRLASDVNHSLSWTPLRADVVAAGAALPCHHKHTWCCHHRRGRQGAGAHLLLGVMMTAAAHAGNDSGDVDEGSGGGDGDGPWAWQEGRGNALGRTDNDIGSKAHTVARRLAGQHEAQWSAGISCCRGGGPACYPVRGGGGRGCSGAAPVWQLCAAMHAATGRLCGVA